MNLQLIYPSILNSLTADVLHISHEILKQL